jgi:hypothetical protein
LGVVTYDYDEGFFRWSGLWCLVVIADKVRACWFAAMERFLHPGRTESPSLIAKFGKGIL